MSFAWPLGLLALLVVPAVIAGYIVVDRRRAGEIERFASPALYPGVVARAPGRLRHLPAAILLVALAAMLVGVARPQATISVPREEATVILALDVSRSMTAKDVPPTRLVAAQAAARRFVEQVPETFRIGVVAFADRANVVAPPTDDREVVAQALEQVSSGEGTALGEAILLSLRAARSVVPPREGGDGGEQQPASVLLISDGAQTQGEVTPAEAARRARRAGIPVFTVSLGTPAGIVERTLVGGYTERVRVPPDPRALRLVARQSGGEFFSAPDDRRLRRVYEELGTRLGEREKRAEVTVAFAGAGLAVALIAGGVSTLLFRRLP